VLPKLVQKCLLYNRIKSYWTNMHYYYLGNLLSCSPTPPAPPYSDHDMIFPLDRFNVLYLDVRVKVLVLAKVTLIPGIILRVYGCLCGIIN
jgi:hypothetical protein